MHPNIIYWLAANRLRGVGSVTIRRCLAFVENIKLLFTSTKDDLKGMGLSVNQIKALLQPDWRAAENDFNWCKKNEGSMLCFEDKLYPPLLKQIHDPPLVLFTKGDIHLLSKPQIAMVGSRNPSIHGKEHAMQFSKCLVQSGFIVTSGLASGIDTASHVGAIAANGKTIAVLGTGLASIYPFSNRRLADDIAKNGVLISEFLPFEGPRAKNFPRRNRIISGLSLGVLVIEAALRSGSLITARFAVEQGREVFAIPGSIQNPLSKGCHALIRNGAKLVEKVEDIVEELGALFAYTSTIQPIPATLELIKLDVESIRLLQQINYDVTSLDVIILRTRLTASQVSSILLSLELQGCVKSVQGGYVRLVNID